MKKEEFIKRYGEAAYNKNLQQTRDWEREHPEGRRERMRLWRLNHPEETKAQNQERTHKGGKHYEQYRKYFSAGIPHARQKIRNKHANCYRPYKQIIAPESQIHHEWIPTTAKYRGMALVEKEPHQHGIIDVIQIMEGEITLLTEDEVKIGGMK